MLKAIYNFGQRLLVSRMGWLLLITHLAIVIYIFAQMSSQTDAPCHEQFHSPGWSTIAGRSFHWIYEPLLMVVFFLDFPAVLVSGIIETLVLHSDWCDYSKSWFMAFIMLFFASIQWLIIGFWLESLLRFSKSPK